MDARLIPFIVNCVHEPWSSVSVQGVWPPRLRVRTVASMLNQGFDVRSAYRRLGEVYSSYDIQGTARQRQRTCPMIPKLCHHLV